MLKKKLFMLMTVAVLVTGCGNTEETNIVAEETVVQEVQVPEKKTVTGEKDRPANEQLKLDLSARVTEHKSFLALQSIEVERSFTEERSYTATVKVIADSKYAEYHLVAEVEYLKYDQGWEIADCIWQENGYTVQRYPDENDMGMLVASDEELQKDHLAEQQYVEMECNEGQVIYKGEIELVWNQYITIDGTIASYWHYKEESDDWYMESYEQNFVYHLDLEGKCIDSKGEESSISITNITDNGFDIQAVGANSNVVHAYFESGEVDANVYIEYRGTGLNYCLNGDEGSNLDFIVKIISYS